MLNDEKREGGLLVGEKKEAGLLDERRETGLLVGGKREA